MGVAPDHPGLRHPPASWASLVKPPSHGAAPMRGELQELLCGRLEAFRVDRLAMHGFDLVPVARQRLPRGGGGAKPSLTRKPRCRCGRLCGTSSSVRSRVIFAHLGLLARRRRGAQDCAEVDRQERGVARSPNEMLNTQPNSAAAGISKSRSRPSRFAPVTYGMPYAEELQQGGELPPGKICGVRHPIPLTSSSGSPWRPARRPETFNPIELTMRGTHR